MLAGLRADYRGMQDMIHGEALKFEAIIEGVTAAELRTLCDALVRRLAER